MYFTEAFQDAQAFLDQPGHLVAVQEVGGDIGQKRSPPQAECRAQQGEFGLSGAGCLRHQTAEVQQVQGVTVGRKAVPPGDRDHRLLLDVVLGEETAQPQDAAFCRAAFAVAGCLSPQTAWRSRSVGTTSPGRTSSAASSDVGLAGGRTTTSRPSVMLSGPSN
ncbi:hypothetical protein SHIRM173S_09077 [Streptomyces hirsutus]